MSWLCSVCGVNNVNLNLSCVGCKVRNGIVTPRNEFEPFDTLDEIIQEKRFKILDRTTGFYFTSGDTLVTPQEELFSKLFNHEKILVKDMSVLELRAHREELSKIAFEARARMTAVDEEEKERKKKSSDGKPTGFARSVNGDDKSSDLINTVKERQKRMSKNEKLQAGLAKLLGGDDKTAAQLMSAGKILGTLKAIENQPKVVEEKKPLFNPFEKKSES